MKQIRGEDKSIRGLLSGRKYGIDYYQREYKWQTKQIQELLTDLTDKFLESYNPGDSRSAVEKYGIYFLGSIIVSDREGKGFIIDGQQRLTSLTLLLIYLHHRQQTVPLKDLIFSERFGTKSYNLDVPDRIPVMDALFNGEHFDSTDKNESVVNIFRRYEDIETLFPSEIDDTALPYFVDWLVENVYLVEIAAASDDDAYTIFETMNDRGLSLNPLDMLKGYLLANIEHEQKRNEAALTWKSRVSSLAELGKEEDSDACKAWLRSQFARSIRERRAGAKPGDFDRLGTEFHRWIKENDQVLGLKQSEDFQRFINRDFEFYGRWYLRARKAAETFTADLPCVYYNAQHRFTLQYPLLLAPLTPEDDEANALKKMRAVSTFIDILISRRLWNYRAIDYSTMMYAMFLVMVEIRGQDLPRLMEILAERIGNEQEGFSTRPDFRMHMQNRRSIHRLLARITDWLEVQSGLASRYTDYVSEGKNRFEVEHIWADKFERHQDEFENAYAFSEYRNRIGDLLLLPKSFNASYGAKSYEEKLEHYYGQNLLAKSLHPRCYENNPGFRSMVDRTGLTFRPHTSFKKADVEERQALYAAIAERVWSADSLKAASA